MPGNLATGERCFVWDDAYKGLLLSGLSKQEDEQAKGQRKQSQVAVKSKIYCPHAYLVLNFREALNPGEKIKYKKLYLRKVAPTEPNVIILQDVKDLVMYLTITPVSIQFVNFFHLPIVDRFLRALIIYFQYYVEIWEDIMQKRAIMIKKAPNPLAGGTRIRYANEMQTLRCVLGREYAELIVGCKDSAPYHHMMAGKKNMSNDVATQSQGEKDLRIFEVLIRLAHRVVWIALQRKYFNVIEIEMHRLFRTDAYNTANRKSGGTTMKDMLEDELCILHGSKMPSKRKLLRNSPLTYQLLNTDCDFRTLLLGSVDIATKDPRIIYLQNALFAKEEVLPELGIKVGILGQSRSDYDVMLTPCEGEEPTEDPNNERDKRDRKRSSLIDKVHKNVQQERDVTRMPPFGLDPELIQVFPVEKIDTRHTSDDKARENARKKWIYRERKRSCNKYAETSSVATILDN